MTDRPIYIIAGLGRCGSTLAMTMLHAGGVDCAGQAPDYEPDQTGIEAFDANWIADQHGRVVKVLTMGVRGVDLVPAEYRIVWLNRDLKQQARSNIKMAKGLGLPVRPPSVPLLMTALREERKVALKKLKAAGPVTRMTFEDLLAHPVDSVQKFERAFGLMIDYPTAAADVVQIRTAKCAPDLAIENALYAASRA